MRKNNVVTFPSPHMWKIKEQCNCDHCFIERRNKINKRHANFDAWLQEIKNDKNRVINVYPSILKLNIKLKPSILLSFFMECFNENEEYPFPILKRTICEILQFTPSELKNSLSKLISFGYVITEDAESPPCGSYSFGCKQYWVNLNLINTQLEALPINP